MNLIGNRQHLTVNRSGFTLIELLVVISIIGILAAMITVSFTASQRQARDTQRKSDLSQYRNALEAYANKTNGVYPASSGADASSFCDTLIVSGNCPEDPTVTKNGAYQYESDGAQYLLWASLENVADTYWVVCSSGQSGKVPKPHNFSSAVCPALTP